MPPVAKRCEQFVKIFSVPFGVAIIEEWQILHLSQQAKVLGFYSADSPDDKTPDV